MVLDPPSMFFALQASTLSAAILLFWCFRLNRAETSLFWCGVGYTVASVGCMALAGRGRVPDWITIDIANALMIFAMALLWTVARRFNGRTAPMWVPLTGVVMWLGLCRIPAFYESFDARIIGAALISSAYVFSAAGEFLHRDGLRLRKGVTIALSLHAAFVMLRIPITLGNAQVSYDGGWFGPIALESMVFAQILAFLLVSVSKERVEASLRAAALTDPLTGLANRRAFFDQGTAMLSNDLRRNRPTAVIVFDLDRFKTINDRYGHPVGDSVLRAFATAIASSLRVGDVAGRIGGEEFAALLPDTTETHAAIAARRVLDAFSAEVAAIPGMALRSTTSAGLAASDGRHASSIAALLAAADVGLYEAKRLGGGRARSAGVLPEPPVHVAA